MSKVFIVAGGPSVASQDTELLRGHRVIAINSSWQRVPFAEILFFGDGRWWRKYGQDVLAGFAGRIVTCAEEERHPRLEKLHRKFTPGLSNDPSTVAVLRTSLTGALNLAVHMGFRSIVLLGADGKAGPDGRMHHHAEYDGVLAASADFASQRKDLEVSAADLVRLGVSVVNASPGSCISFWPIANLEDVI